MPAPELVHASAVLVGARGVLITGSSGSGKSSLAFALLQHSGQGDYTRLVADDRVLLSACSGRLVARAPDSIAGRIELRGIGLFHHPFEPLVQLELVVDLRPAASLVRLPAEDAFRTRICGIELACLALPENDMRNMDRLLAFLRALRSGLDPAALSQ